ncbi:MAG: hypothetical protein ABI239_00210 [Aquihabitans sp.]
MRVLASMAVGLVATVVVTTHLVQVAEPRATEHRVLADDGMSRASQEKPERAEPTPAFLGPELHPDTKVSDATSVRPWFTQGRWWSIFAVSGDGHHLFALAGPPGSWVDTGVLVDDRDAIDIDVVVSGKHLVVVTVGSRSYRREAARVSRFSWNEAQAQWLLDPDFPVEVSDAGVPGGIQVATTDDGRIWLTQLKDRRILLGEVAANGVKVSPFAALPDELAGGDVGSYAFFADHDALHLVWRSATLDQLTSASRLGASWSVVHHEMWGASGSKAIDAAMSGPDHPDAVLVLVPTSLRSRTSNDRAPSVVLVEMAAHRSREAVVAVGEDHLSQPVLVVDPGQDRVSVVGAVEPPRAEPGVPRRPWALTEKRGSVTRLEFSSGRGEVLLEAAQGVSRSLAAPSTITELSGLMVTAIDPVHRSWMTVQQGGLPDGGQPPVPEPSDTASSLVLHDSFESFAPGDSGPSAWYRDGDGPRLASVVDDGGGRALSVVVDPASERSTMCRRLPSWGQQAVTVRAELKAFGDGTSDARLLAVRGPNGYLVEIRRSVKGMVGHLAAAGRVDDLPLPEGGPVVVTLDFRPEKSTVDVSLSLPGSSESKTATIPHLNPFEAGSARLCVGPAPGDPSARVEVADLKVSRR